MAAVSRHRSFLEASPNHGATPWATTVARPPQATNQPRTQSPKQNQNDPTPARQDIIHGTHRRAATDAIKRHPKRGHRATQTRLSRNQTPAALSVTPSRPPPCLARASPAANITICIIRTKPTPSHPEQTRPTDRHLNSRATLSHRTPR